MSVLLISGSVTGVFARYQSNYDANGSVSAANFVINTLDDSNMFVQNGIYNKTDESDIKMAPGEYFTKYFRVQNWGNGQKSEVDIQVDVNVNVKNNIDPLEFYLYSVPYANDPSETGEGKDQEVANLQEFLNSNNPIAEYTTMSDVPIINGVDQYEGVFNFTFTKNVAATHKFLLYVKWSEDISYEEQLKYSDTSIYGSSYNILVNAKQGSTTESMPNVTDVFTKGFLPLLSDEDSNISKYYWNDKSTYIKFSYPGSPSIVKKNGKRNTFFETNSGRGQWEHVSSAGQNYGMPYFVPELAGKLGVSRNLMTSNSAFRISRVPKSYSEYLLNDRFFYNIFYSSVGLDKTTYKEDYWLEDVWFLLADSYASGIGYPGYLVKGKKLITYNPNPNFQMGEAYYSFSSGSNYNVWRPYYLDDPHYETPIRIFDENTVFPDPTAFYGNESLL